MDTKRIKQFLKKLDYSPAPESDAKVREWLKNHNHRFDHYIGGGWQKPAGRTYFSVKSPATGEVLAECAYGLPDDVDTAMRAAREGYNRWYSINGYERSKILYAIARNIEKNSRLLAVLESLNNGKTIRETRDIDLPLVARHFHYYAGWARILHSEYPNRVAPGVIGQVIPWNFPLLMLAWKVAPAIAAGNTVVIKPAEFTPLSTLMLAEIFEDAGLPPGVVNIVTGDGHTGEAVINHHIPWKIAFTGSTEVGKKIRLATAGTGKRLTLELGGKSPFIIHSDADLDSAVEGVKKAVLGFNQGHVCCAGSRLLVQESVYERAVASIKRMASKIRVGHPLDKAMDIGAINSEPQLRKIQELVRVGVEEGGEIWQPEGWSCPASEGFFYPPTVFTNVSPSSTIAKQEIFGPVLVCMSYRTPEEAIQLANNTRYGLAASIWSQDIDTALHIANKLKAGVVWVNSTNMFDAASGFGGYRESGYGREGGRENIFDVTREFTIKREGEKSDTFPPCPIFIHDAVDRTYRFLIGGKLTRPDGAASFQVHAPNGRLLGMIGDANRKDARNAVEAARKAAKDWEESVNREKILRFLAEKIDGKNEWIAEWISRETGQSMYSARKEVDEAVSRLFYYAAKVDKFEGTVQPVPGKFLVTAKKEPIGVMALRAPDRYPLLGAVSLLAPTLAMGNTAVLVCGKYSLTMMNLVEILQASDIPAGALNVLTAANPDAIAKVLADHEGVDGLWYFGNWGGIKSVEIASVSNMKRVWTKDENDIDWMDDRTNSEEFLREATQIKNIWIPYGI